MSALIRASESEPISSRRNPLVGKLRDLHDARGRQQHQRLLLEGTHLLEEALRLGLNLELVLATPDWLARHGSLLAALESHARLQPATAEVLAAVATTRSPDGVVASVAIPSLANASAPNFVLALDRLQDPGNLGTLLRTALAAGVDEVWLADGADPHAPKVLRASSGAALALPVQRLQRDELRQRLEQAGAAGLQRLATQVGDGAQPYWELDWTQPTLLLLGNEGAGLATEFLALADHCVTIPHSGAVESLNVAVAAAPLLLERWRQRLLSGAAAPAT
ncbi:MAG: RNA methyltransferase [Cyanobacteria bacterium]|nr:RNA methyltransferase [Cyanobacteriota bacterium]